MRKRSLVLLALAALAVLLTSSIASSSTTATNRTSRVQDAAADVAKAQQYLRPFLSLPKITRPTVPVKPPAKKLTIGYLNCGDVAVACNNTGKAARRAVAALGGKLIWVDGKLNPQGWNTGMMQLVQRKVDAILVMVAGDNAIPNALIAADKAEIPVVSLFAGNPPGREKEAAHADANVSTDFFKQGKALGSYIVVQSKGTAKVGQITNSTVNVIKTRQAGVAAAIAACGGCKVVGKVEENPGSGQDLNTIIRDATTGLLNRFPGDQLTHIAPPSDDEGVGAIQAIKAAGRNVKTVGYDCTEQGLNAIRTSGVQVACMTTPVEWSAWAGVDQILRLLAKQNPVQQDVPTYVVAKQNVPSSGKRPKQPDYESHYKKLWGVG